MSSTALMTIDPDDYDREARRLTISDVASSQAAMLFLAKVREAEKALEAERKAKTDPLRAEIERVTAPYKVAIEAFAALRLKVQAKLQEYEERVEKLRLEQQQKALADAERIRVQQEQKADAARVEAERLREKGDLLGALKQDQKADKAALVAATTAPMVVEAAPKTITFDGGLSVTKRKSIDWTYENGCLKGAEKYHRDDPRFAGLPDEVWVVDEAKIGAIIRNGGKVAGIRSIVGITPVSRQK